MRLRSRARSPAASSLAALLACVVLPLAPGEAPLCGVPTTNGGELPPCPDLPATTLRQHLRRQQAASAEGDDRGDLQRRRQAAPSEADGAAPPPRRGTQGADHLITFSAFALSGWFPSEGEAEGAEADDDDEDEDDGEGFDGSDHMEMQEAEHEAGNRTLARRIAGWFEKIQTEEERREATDAKAAAEVRRRFMEEKLLVDAAAINMTRALATTLPLWPGAARNVAFLFLAMDGLDFEDVWDEFFARATVGSYSIYVHRGGEEPQKALPLARWGAVEIDRVANGWCALMGVEVALLAAALQDPRNLQLVFVSHNTVPLKGFDYVYQQLLEYSPTTSKFCFADPAWHQLATPETIRNELRRHCIFRDFYRAVNPRTLKHHQWVVLARAHAQIVVQRALEALRIWSESWEVAAPDLGHMGEGCSDESVPSTALLQELREMGRSTGNTWADLARLGIEQQCLTYVLWRHCFTDTDLEHSEPIAKDLSIVRKHGKVSMLTDKDFDFFRSALKRELNGYPAVFDTLEMDYVIKLANEGFMFARKFKKGIQVNAGGVSVPLEVALPAVWDTIDEERASQRVWSRLSKRGMPVPI